MGKKHRKTAPAAALVPVHSLRWKIAAGLALAMAAFSAFVLIYQESVPPQPDSSVTTDARFAAIRKGLPARGTVGYLSDIGGKDFNTNAAYFLAQYSLAPVLLEPGAGHELIVGNFSSPAAIEASLRTNPVTLAGDFGNGVLLLRKAPR